MSVNPATIPTFLLAWGWFAGGRYDAQETKNVSGVQEGACNVPVHSRRSFRIPVFQKGRVG
jgi:hypothetical protein